MVISFTFFILSVFGVNVDYSIIVQFEYEEKLSFYK